MAASPARCGPRSAKDALRYSEQAGRHLRPGHEVHQVRRIAASHDGRHASHVVGWRDDLQLHVGVERLVDRLPGRVLIECWWRATGVAGHGGDVGAEAGCLRDRLEQGLGVGEVAVLQSGFVAWQVRLRTLDGNVGRQAGCAGPDGGRGGGGRRALRGRGSAAGLNEEGQADGRNAGDAEKCAPVDVRRGRWRQYWQDRDAARLWLPRVITLQRTVQARRSEGDSIPGSDRVACSCVPLGDERRAVASTKSLTRRAKAVGPTCEVPLSEPSSRRTWGVLERSHESRGPLHEAQPGPRR